MHKVDVYLCKNACYILVLANLVALLLYRWWNLFLLLNLLAITINASLIGLIRLTISRYSETFGKSKGQIKDLLGRYIDDNSRPSRSFYDDIENSRQTPPSPETEKYG